MKKMFLVFLIVVFTLTTCACSKDDNPQNNKLSLQQTNDNGVISINETKNEDITITKDYFSNPNYSYEYMRSHKNGETYTPLTSPGDNGDAKKYLGHKLSDTWTDGQYNYKYSENKKENINIDILDKDNKIVQTIHGTDIIVIERYDKSGKLDGTEKLAKGIGTVYYDNADGFYSKLAAIYNYVTQ